MSVVDKETGKMLGEMKTEQALALAAERGLDLVEISPKVSPPVCKIMDFGQFRYEQKRSERKGKKSQKQTEVKGIRFSFRIEEHDLMVRQRQAQKFLEVGNKVKISMPFRGREVMHKDIGVEKIRKFVQSLEEISHVELDIKMKDNPLILILSPTKKK